jgi:hypothetical protein
VGGGGLRASLYQYHLRRCFGIGCDNKPKHTTRYTQQRPGASAAASAAASAEAAHKRPGKRQQQQRQQRQRPGGTLTATTHEASRGIGSSIGSSIGRGSTQAARKAAAIATTAATTEITTTTPTHSYFVFRFRSIPAMSSLRGNALWSEFSESETEPAAPSLIVRLRRRLASNR